MPSRSDRSEALRLIAFSLLAICVLGSALACKKAQVPKTDAPKEESALQEYVNEPKRQANRVKHDLESAQLLRDEQAESIRAED